MPEIIMSRRKFVSSGVIGLSGIAAMGLPSVGSNADPVRVGIIGTGSGGGGLMELIKDIPGIQVIACCDIIPEYLANDMSLAAKGAKSYTVNIDLTEKNCSYE